MGSWFDDLTQAAGAAADVVTGSPIGTEVASGVDGAIDGSGGGSSAPAPSSGGSSTMAQALSGASTLAGIGSVVGGLGSLGAGAIEANAASSATDKSLALQETEFNTQQGNLAPYLAAAKPALASLTTGTAPGGEFENSFTMKDFLANEDPSYGFDLSQGELALDRSAAARGTLNSGGTMKDAMTFGTGLASQEFGNAYQRFMTTRQNNMSNLATVAGLGQGATGQSVAAGSAAAQGESGTTMAGVMGAGGAIASGISGATQAATGGLNNLGQYSMLAALAPQLTASSNSIQPQPAA